mmetsp:Transcript_124000/g.201567  ORF Transcript_124000/g.201567 Transcript_124000/m.201567 type:complete len:202 (+) Transcript_124000:565-1170(+)
MAALNSAARRSSSAFAAARRSSSAFAAAAAAAACPSRPSHTLATPGASQIDGLAESRSMGLYGLSDLRERAARPVPSCAQTRSSPEGMVLFSWVRRPNHQMLALPTALSSADAEAACRAASGPVQMAAAFPGGRPVGMVLSSSASTRMHQVLSQEAWLSSAAAGSSDRYECGTAVPASSRDTAPAAPCLNWIRSEIPQQWP